jgi:hypothetical protein
MLQGLVERAGVSDGIEKILILCTRPGDAFHWRFGEMDIDTHGRLNTGAAYLAAPLHEMCIPRKKQPAIY